MINPFIPKTDQHVTSPYNIHAQSKNSYKTEEKILKIYKTVLITENCKRNHEHFLFINECTWRYITENLDRRNFESLHTLFVICTCDTTLHSCFKRMHLFSANQKLVIFSCKLSNTVIIWCKCFRWLHEVALRYTLPKRV